MKILIVDDNAQMRILLKITFSTKPEYDVVEAKNAEEALNIIRTQHIDIMFLDIMMPGDMNGLGVCDFVKNSEYKSCFIVLLSAKGQKLDIQIGMELGADRYVTKPFSPIQLIEIVEEFIESKR